MDMNIFKATVETAAQAAIAYQFSQANIALKESYRDMAKSANRALGVMDQGRSPYTIGGNQVERLLAAQAKFETMAGMLSLTGLSREQIADLVAADAVSIEAVNAE